MKQPIQSFYSPRRAFAEKREWKSSLYTLLKPEVAKEPLVIQGPIRRPMRERLNLMMKAAGACGFVFIPRHRPADRAIKDDKDSLMTVDKLLDLRKNPQYGVHAIRYIENTAKKEGNYMRYQQPSDGVHIFSVSGKRKGAYYADQRRSRLQNGSTALPKTKACYGQQRNTSTMPTSSEQATIKERQFFS